MKHTRLTITNFMKQVCVISKKNIQIKISDGSKLTDITSLKPKNIESYDDGSRKKKQKTGQQENVSQSSKEENEETDDYAPFIYVNNGRKHMFRRTSYDYKLICPCCLKETKQIIQHICKGSCMTTINMNDFKSQLKEYKKAYTKETHKKRQRESIERQRALNESKVKECQNKWKKESRDKQRAQDESKVKMYQNKRKKMHRKTKSP